MAERDQEQVQVQPEYVVNLRGKDFVVYAGVLDVAHRKGIRRLETDVVQFPTEANGRECVVRATLELEGGVRYSDYGDANPSNVNRAIAAHIIRMASTRAKARVLRDAANIGLTALEELGSLDDDEAPAPALAMHAAPAPQARVAAGAGSPARGTSATDAQLRAIRSIARSKGMTPEATEDLSRRRFNRPVGGLNLDEASNLIRELQRM